MNHYLLRSHVIVLHEFRFCLFVTLLVTHKLNWIQKTLSTNISRRVTIHFNNDTIHISGCLSDL